MLGSWLKFSALSSWLYALGSEFRFLSSDAGLCLRGAKLTKSRAVELHTRDSYAAEECLRTIEQRRANTHNQCTHIIITSI